MNDISSSISLHVCRGRRSALLALAECRGFTYWDILCGDDGYLGGEIIDIQIQPSLNKLVLDK